MNKIQEKIVQALNPSKLTMTGFSSLIYKAMNLGVFDEELMQHFKKYLINQCNDEESFVQTEIFETLAFPYNNTMKRPAFELLKTYVNQIVERPYKRFNKLISYSEIFISLIDCEKFSLIPKDKYDMKCIYEINNQFGKFLKNFILNQSLDVELENNIEDILESWSLIDLRTFCMNFKSNSFVQDYFTFLESDNSMYRDCEKVYNKLRYHFTNEEAQYEYLETYRDNSAYSITMTPLFEIVDIFKKYFQSDTVSTFMDVVIFFSQFDTVNKEINKDKFYNSFMVTFVEFIRTCDAISKDDYKLEFLHRNIYPPIIKSLCSFSIKDEDMMENICKLSLEIFKDAYEQIEYRDSKVMEVTCESITNVPMTYEGALEAYKKSSGTIQKAERGVYRAYKKYKIQEDKVDSQAQKVVNWMKKLVVGDKRKEVIEGKTYTPLSLLKRLLITIGVFSVSHVAAACMLIVRFALSKNITRRERQKIVSDLEIELELLNEKIDDAKAAGDNKAKYEMMRSRAELQKAIKKIRYGIEASSKVTDNVKAAIGV